MNRRPLAVPGHAAGGRRGGMTNPFNGEGIAYAMETGELAAELIGDALARNRPAIAHMYPVLLRERYGRYFHVGRQWVRVIGNPAFMRCRRRARGPAAAAHAFALRAHGQPHRRPGRRMPRTGSCTPSLAGPAER